MLSNNLSNIENVGLFQIIPLFIFVTLFIGMVLYIVKMDKNIVNKMENLPLEDGTEQIKEGN